MSEDSSTVTILASILGAGIGAMCAQFLARMRGGLIKIAQASDKNNTTVVSSSLLSEVDFREWMLESLNFEQDRELVFKHADTIWPAFRVWTKKDIEQDAMAVGVYYAVLNLNVHFANIGNSPTIMLSLKKISSSLDHIAIIEVAPIDCKFPIPLKEGEVLHVQLSITLEAINKGVREAHELFQALNDGFHLTLNVQWLSISALIIRKVKPIIKKEGVFVSLETTQENMISPGEFKFAMANFDEIQDAINKDLRDQLKKTKNKNITKMARPSTDKSDQALIELQRFAYTEEISCLPAKNDEFIILQRNDDARYSWSMTVARIDSETIYCMSFITQEILEYHGLDGLIELVEVDEKIKQYNNFGYYQGFLSSLEKIEIVKRVIMILEIENTP